MELPAPFPDKVDASFHTSSPPRCRLACSNRSIGIHMHNNTRQRPCCRPLQDFTTISRIEDGSMSGTDQCMCCRIVMDRYSLMGTRLFIGNKTICGKMHQ